MTFAGMRDFRTATPAELRQDLQRLNVQLEQAFAEIERARDRWNVVLVREATGQAQHGDLVLAGFDRAAVVRLPRSTEETRGRSVLVTPTSGLGSVTVVPQAGQFIGDGLTELALGGLRMFVDDGLGRLWAL